MVSVLNLGILPFITINVDPTSCVSEAGVNGTCFNREQCKEKGGLASGTCANGFGVCCLCK